jgi:hypothetical protein
VNVKPGAGLFIVKLTVVFFLPSPASSNFGGVGQLDGSSLIMTRLAVALPDHGPLSPSP